jgi:tetratricopeptide (TPR) repeat protein
MKTIPSILCHLITASLLWACTGQYKQETAKPIAPGDDAVAVLTERIIANPNNPQWYIERAYAYSDRGMFDLSKRDIDRIMLIDSMASTHHAAKGEIFFRARELRTARLSFERAVELDAQNTAAMLKLAEVNFLLRRYKEAIEAADRALGVNERTPKAYFLKGYIFKELGDTSRALSSFQTATEVDPEYYDAFMELGYLYAAKGNPLAIEYFNTALDLRPASSEAYYHKGMFYQAAGHFQDAMEVYRAMVKADANAFLGYYNMGYLHLVELGEFRTAAAYFDTVLTIQPGYIDALFNKGLSYEELGEERTAVAIYQEVLSRDPQHTLAAMGLERLLEK